jgi:hypothetical protein
LLDFSAISGKNMHLLHILVGGLEHLDYFSHHIANFIIPTDELIFFRGVGIPPTSIRIYTLIISYLYIYRDRYCAYLLPFLRDCFFDLHVPPSKAHRGMGPRDFAGILTCKTVENPMVSLGK